MSRVHLIGICGTAMATLAVLLKARGDDVSGSDEHVYPPMSDVLAQHGIAVQPGYSDDHITDDLELVVIGNAVSRGNPEVEAVLDRRLRYASLPEVLRNEFLWSRESIVVAGTHGKTTTSFMVAWMLEAAGEQPSFLIGGVPRNFETSGQLAGGRAFVVEGDEYDSAFFDKTAKFLKYLPSIVVVNGIEYDHADIYPDLSALRQAFVRLVRLIPRTGRLIVRVEDAEAMALRDEARCPVETFGLTPSADWQARAVDYGRSSTRFEIARHGAQLATVELPLLGEFNVANGVAAVAAASAYGLDPRLAAMALRRFRGVKRRLEIRGVRRDITVWDDFAHHPTAVRETLAAVRASAPPGRIWAVFEPRSATACRKVFQHDFAEALQRADEVIVAAVYRQTLSVSDRLSETQLVADLTARGVSASFLPSVDAIVQTVSARARAGDQIVVMSNGGFGGVHNRILASLDAANVASASARHEVSS